MDATVRKLGQPPRPKPPEEWRRMFDERFGLGAAEQFIDTCCKKTLREAACAWKMAHPGKAWEWYRRLTGKRKKLYRADVTRGLLRKLARTGIGICAATAAVGLSRKAMTRRCRRWHITFKSARGTTGRRRAVSGESVAAMLAAGASKADVAFKLGVSRQTIYRRIQERGWDGERRQTKGPRLAEAGSPSDVKGRPAAGHQEPYRL